MADRRRIIVNPDEPGTGDHGYSFYDRAHPHFGEESEVQRLRKQLRGLRGKDVTVKVRVGHKPRGGVEKVVTMQRTITLNRYTDIFGSGGVYGEILHEIREAHSEDRIVAYYIDIAA